MTILNQTPSAFRQLMAADERAEESGTASHSSEEESLSLRAVIFGGEALELQSLQGWLARHGDEQPELINMYGITETTVHVTYRRIQKRDVEEQIGSVIGRALSDLDVYVLDSADAASAGRSQRRAVCWRGGLIERLLESSGVNGRALHSRPVQSGGRSRGSIGVGTW